MYTPRASYTEIFSEGQTRPPSSDRRLTMHQISYIGFGASGIAPPPSEFPGTQKPMSNMVRNMNDFSVLGANSLLGPSFMK